MIRTERREVIKKEFDDVPVSGCCDVCGSELKPIDKRKRGYAYTDGEIYDYYRITTHHHDWGNDSIESYKYKDCCCLNCALLFIENYWDGCTKSTPWPTLELEMKHECQLIEHE